MNLLEILGKAILFFGILTLLVYAARWKAENMELKGRVRRLSTNYLAVATHEAELEQHVWQMSQLPPVEPTPAKLTPEEIEALRKGGQCVHCGGYHARSCLRVRRVRFGVDNRPIDVAYWAKWDTTSTIWPEDLALDELEDAGVNGS